MNFIKKIFENRIDEETHRQFSRFGMGEYERAYVKISKGKDLKIKTSFEFSNDLVNIIASNSKEDLEVTGKIIADYDFQSEVSELEDFSKRGKLFTGVLNTTLTPQRLKEIYEKFKLQHILLSLVSKDFKLKCAPKLPKPGGKVKDNFCSATLPLELIDEFAFDLGKDFKKAEIKHIYNIKEIIIPDEYKDDFAQAKIHAKRSGIINRIILLDGIEKTVEKECSI